MVAVTVKELIYVKYLAQYLSKWVLNDTSFLLLLLALDAAQSRIQIQVLLLTSYMTLDQSFHLCNSCLLVSF